MPSLPKDFEKVVQRYYRDLFRFAMSLVNQEADAIDLTQQTFLKFATKGHQMREPSRVKSWLFRTLKNEFIDQHRRSKRYPHVELETSDSHLQLVAEPGSGFSGIDTSTALNALQSLDEKYRIPLTLFYLEGLTYKEIAAALDVPSGTVMSRLSRGKQKLRAAFSAPQKPQP